MNDILLDNKDDLICVNGDFATGDATIQDVGLIVRLNQGESKEDPILGLNLIRYIKAKVNDAIIRSQLKWNLIRDGKNYNKIKEYITLKGKTNE